MEEHYEEIGVPDLKFAICTNIKEVGTMKHGFVMILNISYYKRASLLWQYIDYYYLLVKQECMCNVCLFTFEGIDIVRFSL